MVASHEQWLHRMSNGSRGACAMPLRNLVRMWRCGAEVLLLRCACALADAGIERTYNFKQEDILKHVEVGAAQKVFDLGLPDLGPYKVRQSRGACDFSQGRMQPAVGGQRVVPDAECLLSRPQPSLVLSAQPRAALGSFTRHPHAHPRRSRTTHCAAPSSSPCCCRLTSPATGATCCWGGGAATWP